MYTTEVRVYRDVLPGTGVEAPAVYAIDATGDDVEFVIRRVLRRRGRRRPARLRLALRRCGTPDVSYLLTSALATADRRACERSPRRVPRPAAGPPGSTRPGPTRPGPATGRTRCTAMMWPITPDGVHNDAAQVECLRRCLAAADDLDTLEALR